MPIDSQLVDDTCPFMIPGPTPDWWTSNDIKLIGPGASGVALPGETNRVQITTRRNGREVERPCTLPDGTDFFRLELYVCNPTGSPLKINSPRVKKIFHTPMTTPQEVFVELFELNPGGTFNKVIHWKLPSAPTHEAEKEGHKCLIARIYSNTSPPPGDDIDQYAAALDQHYVQRNICIGTCASPCGVDVWTENLQEEPIDVTFRLVADLNPREELFPTLIPLLEPFGGTHFSDTIPSNGFSLEFPDFPDLKIRPVDDPDTGMPAIEVDITLPPMSYFPYRFVTDIEGASPGTVHLFHLKHVERGEVLSGLTIVMIKEQPQ